jgi:hypothetical protein
MQGTVGSCTDILKRLEKYLPSNSAAERERACTSYDAF